MTVEYTPRGVCSRKMIISAEDSVITDAQVIGGCNGNNQGVCRLVVGMKLEDAILKLRGIDCGGRGTSCPDQLTIAMQELLSLENS